MGIAFNPWRLLLNPSEKVQLNTQVSVPFGSFGNNDTFQSTSVERYFDENYIKSAVSQNKELKQILISNKIPLHFNMEELSDLKRNHCKDTAEICAMIYKNLTPAIKSKVNIKDLKDGAMLHDIGKVLIPPEILNKDGKLSEKEYDIMHKHSELGYHILKNSSVNNEVLNLVRNHHDNKINSKNFVPDVNLQILNLADRYSALTEKRVYKKALTPKQALTVILGEVKKGDVHPMLYNALVKAVKQAQDTTKTNINIS